MAINSFSRLLTVIFQSCDQSSDDMNDELNFSLILQGAITDDHVEF